MIQVFTPSFADEANTNAQNLTVKEVISRLDATRFRVTMFCQDVPDHRLSQRPNTSFIAWNSHGNTARVLLRCLLSPPDIYFFPRQGPLDQSFLTSRDWFHLSTGVVTYIVTGGLEVGPIPKPMMHCIKKADALVANNTFLAEIMHRRTGIPTPVIYDGIDRRYFFPATQSRDRNAALTVLYAGSLRPYKRVHLVVRAAALWPQVKFRIAGTGEEEPKCRELASQLGCTNVDFLGHLPSQQLGREMRSADLFLFPSNCEGHPQVLGQAAACGLPCIAMKSYRPDYVDDGVSGFLVDGDEELNDKLGLLLCDPNLRAAMSAAAVERSQAFDWDATTRQWEQVFESVVMRKTSS
jgi:glycosyltransferase involved in cell wall biosynthesis